MYEIINIGTIMINLLILGLSLKLYTEYFKNEAIKKRNPAKKVGTKPQ